MTPLDKLNEHLGDDVPVLAHLKREITQMVEGLDILRNEENSEEVTNTLDRISRSIDMIVGGDFHTADQVLDDCRQRINFLASQFVEEDTADRKSGEHVTVPSTLPPSA